MEHYYSWPLGGDYDCETCGRTNNEASLELYDEDNKIWQFAYRSGCYGGEGILSSEPEWETKTADIIVGLEEFENFTEKLKQEIETLLSNIAAQPSYKKLYKISEQDAKILASLPDTTPPINAQGVASPERITKLNTMLENGEPLTIFDIEEVISSSSTSRASDIKLGRQLEQERIIKMLEEHATEMEGDFVENSEHSSFLEGIREAISIIKLNVFLQGNNNE
jgi:hypothetical protein